MNDNNYITIRRNVAIELIRDMTEATYAFRKCAIHARHDARNFSDSDYFSAEAIRADAVLQAHEAVLLQVLDAAFSGGVHYCDIFQEVKAETEEELF